MSTLKPATKELCYAYPTSLRAKAVGKYHEGAWLVCARDAQGQEIEFVACPYSSAQAARVGAETLYPNLPWHTGFLRSTLATQAGLSPLAEGLQCPTTPS